MSDLFSGEMKVVKSVELDMATLQLIVTSEVLKFVDGVLMTPQETVHESP